MKSQISIEFIMIFAIVVFIVIGFIYVIQNRIGDITEQQNLVLVRNLANSIKNEVIIAASVNNNYIRRFSIPARIGSSHYNMSIRENELLVQLYEDNNITLEYFSVLPVDVKGTFIENITANTTEHCITKNEIDGIRISRNQASLVPNVSSVNNGRTFAVIVNLNCIENIRSAQFSIVYDLNLILESVEPLEIATHRKLNPLFQDSRPIEVTNVPGRLTYVVSFVTDVLNPGQGIPCPSGSGSIARLIFRAHGSGNAEINFDPVLGDDNLKLTDCSFTLFNEEDLPDTKQGTVVQIT